MRLVARSSSTSPIAASRSATCSHAELRWAWSRSKVYGHGLEDLSGEGHGHPVDPRPGPRRGVLVGGGVGVRDRTPDGPGCDLQRRAGHAALLSVGAWWVVVMDCSTTMTRQAEHCRS